MIYYTNSDKETEAVGEQFGRTVKDGTVVAMYGDLGAGKTAFVRGMARGMGITSRVNSPTFTIVNEYRKGNIPLFHFDVYRIESSDEMYDIGWEDYISQGAIVIVEWATLIEDIFDENIIKIYISKNLDLGEDYREINVEGITV